MLLFWAGDKSELLNESTIGCRIHGTINYTIVNRASSFGNPQTGLLQRTVPARLN
jgi:hypothetical protein